MGHPENLEIKVGESENASCVLTQQVLPPELYAPDVRVIMQATVERYGATEWCKVVSANNIHGHLGIYSTLGAKMGCLAQLLSGGGEEPHVLSYAGSQPPVSCLNDGLQVSTGATMGHGLFAVSDEAVKRVEAVFTWKTRKLRLRLKPQYEQAIQSDIRRGVEQYAHTPPYWAYVRSLALKYWSEWSAADIFSAEWL